MRRYLYSNLLKIIFGSLLIITFIPSLVYFVCSLLIDKSINIDLYNAINKLSDELRVTTILFYFNDLTYKEISKVLDIPEGTVKSRISRAKDRLYIMLKD